MNADDCVGHKTVNRNWPMSSGTSDNPVLPELERVE